MRRSFCFGTGLLFLATLAQPAAADLITTYNFNTPDNVTGSATCGTGGAVCGKVTLDQVSSTEVQVTVSLTENKSTGFINLSTGTNPVFGFNIAGDPGATISGITSSPASSAVFSVGPTGFNEGTTFGKFDYSIDCTGCTGSNVTTLTFDVNLTGGGNLALGRFDTKSSGGSTGAYFFAADQTNGSHRGFVGVVPEPEAPTFAFFASPLMALFFLRRRRFRTATDLMGR